MVGGRRKTITGTRPRPTLMSRPRSDAGSTGLDPDADGGWLPPPQTTPTPPPSGETVVHVDPEAARSAALAVVAVAAVVVGLTQLAAAPVHERDQLALRARTDRRDSDTTAATSAVPTSARISGHRGTRLAAPPPVGGHDVISCHVVDRLHRDPDEGRVGDHRRAPPSRAERPHLRSPSDPFRNPPSPTRPSPLPTHRPRPRHPPPRLPVPEPSVPMTPPSSGPATTTTPPTAPQTTMAAPITTCSTTSPRLADHHPADHHHNGCPRHATRDHHHQAANLDHEAHPDRSSPGGPAGMAVDPAAMTGSVGVAGVAPQRQLRSVPFRTADLHSAHALPPAWAESSIRRGDER